MMCLAGSTSLLAQSGYGTDSAVDYRANDAVGSTNVPMDSWIYPALERLGALGLIPPQNVLILPWTRQECLRQVREV